MRSNAGSHASLLVLLISINGLLPQSARGAGTLSGSFSSIPRGTVVNLTAAGPLDWVHWGLYTESSLDRKAGVNPLISDFEVIYDSGDSNAYAFAYQFGDNYNGYSWSDGVPTGNVTFMDGGTPLGTKVLVNTLGVATATLTTSITQLLGGTHTITAVYDGLDPLFSGSTSASFTQTVLQHSTTTTITNAVANPSTFGSSVTFTATVTPRIGAIQPTGTLSFYDGVVTPAECTRIRTCFAAGSP